MHVFATPHVSAPAGAPTTEPIANLGAKLRAGIEATAHVDQAIAGIYCDRFAKNLTRTQSFMLAHEKLFSTMTTALVASGVAISVGGFFGGILVASLTDYHILGMTYGGVAVLSPMVGGSIGASSFGPGKVRCLRTGARSESDKFIALERNEVAPLASDSAKSLSGDERAAVRDYVLAWADAAISSQRLGPQSRLELAAMFETCKEQPVVADAVKLVRDKNNNGSSDGYMKRVTALLEQTPSENRRELADIMRSYLFNGDKSRIAYIDGTKASQLYEQLSTQGVIGEDH